MPVLNISIYRSARWVWRHCLILMAVGIVSLAAQIPASKEYQIKAVFLFNFAQFVEWPPEAFPESETPLVIGVLGEDPFGPYLDETVRGETVREHSLVIRRYHNVEDITGCHILYISRSEAGRLSAIITKLRGTPILTVSDTPGFAAAGGIIRLLTENNKIRLRINLEAAKTANLKISSKLLRPAEIVPSGKD